MTIRNRFPQHNQTRSSGADKSTHKCVHCNKSGHTKDCCFELVGYPEWWDHNRKKNSKKISTAAVAKIETKDDDASKTSSMAAAIGNGDGNQDISNLNTSGRISDTSRDHPQTVSVNPEESELDLSVLSLDSNGDEHPEVEVVAQSPSMPSAPNTPNQLLAAEDVLEPFKKLPPRHNREEGHIGFLMSESLDTTVQTGVRLEGVTTFRSDLTPIMSGGRVTSVLLNGRNFASWSRALKLFIGGRGKVSWLLGNSPRPADNDLKVDQWDIDNYQILGWMFGSMEPQIFNMLMYHETVESLWTALTSMYAHSINEARLFELYQETRWDEMAQYEPVSEYGKTASVAVKRLDRLHTYFFLMGLKPEFEHLRTQILNSSPMPSLMDIFAIVDGDERRRLISSLIPKVASGGNSDQMAFATSSRPSGSRPSDGRRYCHHCGNIGYLKDTCWKLYPEMRAQFQRAQPNSRTDLQAQMTLLMSQRSTPTPPIFSTASTTTILSGTTTASHVHSGSPSWILDYGANDHMTGELSLFSSPLVPTNASVRVADGSITAISSKGDVRLSSDITPSSVLHVPKIAFNLLSVSCIAKSFDCAVIFLPDHCFLQDRTSKRIFGRGYEHEGLYYFGDP
ncbi:hypothetical protein EZV62_014173 [Acer yangbiense]|uniref:Uncharacterized protein n=1 Tax=Acer yangbiense TaxID=1000413 RepID=A0A5C7HRJ8_9ROSI|nr:hypothetical protein EZV62_014173 [Acer yangbiense]